MSDTERRRFPRLQAPAYFRTASIFGPKSAVSNISLGGMRVYSDVELRTGQRLEIEVFPPDAASFVLLACVVWSHDLPADAGARFDVGLTFIDLPPDSIELLKRLLGG